MQMDSKRDLFLKFVQHVVVCLTYDTEVIHLNRSKFVLFTIRTSAVLSVCVTSSVQ